MAFGSGDDVEIKVTLNAEQAKSALDQLQRKGDTAFTGLQKGAKKSEGSLLSLSNVLTGAAVLGAAKLAGALIDAGDKLSDVSEAFEEASEKAGVFSEKLLSDLNAATKETVSNVDLMVQANKLFKLSIDPSQYDDLAFAAQRYADATGTDLKQAFDQLIQAIKSGRETQLQFFGTVKDGKLVVDEFTDAQRQQLETSKNLQDRIEGLGKRVQDAAGAFGKTFVESENLRQAFNELFNGIEDLIDGFFRMSEVMTVAVNDVFGTFKGEINEFSLGLDAFLLETINPFSEGFLTIGKAAEITAKNQLPAFRAQLEKAAAKMKELGKEGKGAGENNKKAFVALPKLQDDVAKATKKAADEVEKQKKELEGVDRAVRELLGFDSFPALTKLIGEAFKKAPNDLDLAKQLQSIAAEAQKAKVPLEEVTKRIGLIQGNQPLQGPLTKEGVFDPITKGIDELKKTDFSIGGLLGDLFGGSETANLIADGLGGALTSALGSLANGGELDTQAIGQSLGTAIGAAIGAYFGGPQGAVAGAAAGNFLGSFTTAIHDLFGKDGAGTKARKEADRFFADVFDADRLSVVINGEIKRIRDLSFTGGATTDALTELFDSGIAHPDFHKNNPSFDPTQNAAFLQTLPANAQAAFQGVGQAFESLLGVAEDISRQIGAVLANNIGGELNNLQLLVQTTGRTFEELGNAIIDSFLNGVLTIQEAQSALVGLQEIFTAGIPGEIGAIDQAFQNFQVSLADGKGSRALIDALRDIGAEAAELGVKDFPSLANQLVQIFGFSAQQVTAFFESMKVAGITSIQELANASTAQLIAVAANVDALSKGQAATNTPVTDPTAGITAPGNFTAGAPAAPKAGGSVDTAAQKQKRILEQIRNETLKAFQASKQYEDITKKLADGFLKQKDAGQQLKDLYQKIFQDTKALTAAENAYEKELEKGRKANNKRLGELAEKIATLKGKLEEFDDAQKVVNINLGNFGNDLNVLGIFARETGQSFNELSKNIVNAFKAGELSAGEATAKLKQTKDILEGGIPNAVGAVEQAFRNLLKGGTKGGAFTLDAFRDIFIEAKEKFLEGQNPTRAKEFTKLATEFNKSRDELQEALDSGQQASESAKSYAERIKLLEERFAGAKKVLEDFNAVIPTINFDDLRQFLEDSFDPTTVNSFFEALKQNGLATFDQLLAASEADIIPILQTLSELSFPFEETNDEITKLINQLKQLQEPRNVDVTLNVKSNAADSETDSLFKLIFGSGGADVNVTVTGPGNGGDNGGGGGGGGGGGSGLTKAERARFELLRGKRKNGRLTSTERSEFEALRKKRGR